MAKRSTKKKATPEAVAIPAACPRCKSTRLASIPGARTIVREIAGVERTSGLAFRSVTWVDRLCECGQRVRVRSYRA